MDYKKIARFSIPLFILWPFGGFIASLFNFKSKTTAIIYITFVTLFGYSFSFTNTSADSYRVAWVFNEFDHGSVSDVFEQYLLGNVPDLYRDVLYSTTQSFTNNPKVLFALMGFVFGIFSYLTFLEFMKFKEIKRNIYFFILLIAFFALNPFANINGARFWTASIILLYAVFQLFYHDRKIWIIGIAFPLLIHFSFIFLVPAILVLYFITPFIIKEKKIPNLITYSYFTAFIFSFLLGNNLIGLDSLIDFLPNSIAYKVRLYNSAEVTESYQERGQSLFHIVSKTFGYFTRFFLFLISVKIINQMNKIKSLDTREYKFYNFILMLFTICFLVSIFPSGGRFLIVANQLFLFFVVRYFFKVTKNNLKKLILLLLPAFIFTILFQVFFLSISLTEGSIWYGNLFWIIYDGIGFNFSKI